MKRSFGVVGSQAAVAQGFAIQPTRDRTQVAAAGMLIVALVMAGSNGIIASGISLPSLQTVLMRTVIAAFALGLMLATSRAHLKAAVHKKEAGFVALAGASLAATWLFLFEAYEYVGVGLSTVLMYCAPIIVMALSPIVFRESLSKTKVVGFCVVVLGAALVNGVALQGGMSAYGIGCGLASAVCFASMLILNKKASHIDGVEKVFIEIASAALVVMLYSLICHGVTLQMVLVEASSDMLPLLALGLSTAIGNFFYLKGVDKLPMQSVAVLGYVEPLAAVGLGALVLGESLLPLQLVGATLIIAGAVYSEVSRKAK